MRSGRASVAHPHPLRLRPQPAARHAPPPLHVLVDGSDSAVAGEAVDSLHRRCARTSLLAIARCLTALCRSSLRPSILYNPAMRSANFFIPGLIAVLLQIMIILLISLSLVRERERGTLEQLNMTPVAAARPHGWQDDPLRLPRLSGTLPHPHRDANRLSVPIHGSLLLLLVMSLPFLLTVLGLGLMISTRAKSRPKPFSSPWAPSCPPSFSRATSFRSPTCRLLPGRQPLHPRHLLHPVMRGIVLRGAGFSDLWLNALRSSPSWEPPPSSPPPTPSSNKTPSSRNVLTPRRARLIFRHKANCDTNHMDIRTLVRTLGAVSSSALEKCIAASYHGDSANAYPQGPRRRHLPAHHRRLKIFAYALAAPFLLIAFLAAFVCVLLDFAWFRTHDLFLGHPQPKGLWEF